MGVPNSARNSEFEICPPSLPPLPLPPPFPANWNPAEPGSATIVFSVNVSVAKLLVCEIMGGGGYIGHLKNPRPVYPPT